MGWIVPRGAQGLPPGCATPGWIPIEKSAARTHAFRLEATAVRRFGVCEIRVHTDLEHRVIYVARLAEAVYVLHVFEKRTRKTFGGDLALAKLRLADILRHRVQRKES